MNETLFLALIWGLGIVMVSVTLLLIWRSYKPGKFWAAMGYCAVIGVMGIGAQVGGRPFTEHTPAAALLAFAVWLLFCAAFIGVRHLLTRRDSGQVSE